MANGKKNEQKEQKITIWLMYFPISSTRSKPAYPLHKQEINLLILSFFLLGRFTNSTTKLNELILEDTCLN